MLKSKLKTTFESKKKTLKISWVITKYLPKYDKKKQTEIVQLRFAYE